MNRPHRNRARLGGVLLAAVTALAMLILPGLAAGHDHHNEAAGNAGTIESFDPATGALVIDLTEGGSASGLVTTRTHIRCGEDHGHRHGLGRRGRSAATASHDGSGEHQGRGPDGEGPGRGEEPGEDTPGHDGTPPDNNEDPGHAAEHADRCTSEDLVAGTTVRVAELVLLDGKAIYAFVGLEPTAPEEAPTT